MGMQRQVVMLMAETSMMPYAGRSDRVNVHCRASDVRDSMAEPVAHFDPDPMRLFGGGVRLYSYMRLDFEPMPQPASANL